MFDNFEIFIQKCELEDKEMIVLGDLNCDVIKSPCDTHTTKHLNICTLYQPKQFIGQPTRVTKTSATLIDLVLANNPESISNIGGVNLGISDHSLLFAVQKMVPPKNQRPYKEFRNFKNFNEGQFLEELNTIPWDYVNQFNDPNDSWQIWKSFFLETLDRHAPI